jgi:chromate transporter
MPSSADSPSTTPITLGNLLKAWLQVGFQSFGGGSSTLTLIRRTFVEQLGWMTDLDFVRTNAICQACPGINIICLTILLGARFGGIAGIYVSLGGMLVPAAGITIAMTAAYSGIRHLPTVQEALRGVIPATVGVGLLTNWAMGSALFGEARAGGSRLEMSASALVVVLSGILIARGATVIDVLCIGGATMAIVRARCARKGSIDDPDEDRAAMAVSDSEEQPR